MTEETTGYPGLTKMTHFYIVERRIPGEDEVLVIGAKTEEIAVKSFASLVDHAFDQPTYIVRAYRAPVPDDFDPQDVRRAAQLTMEVAQSDYKLDGVEQVAAFARLENDVLVDMSLISTPHLAG